MQRCRIISVKLKKKLLREVDQYPAFLETLGTLTFLKRLGMMVSKWAFKQYLDGPLRLRRGTRGLMESFQVI